MMDVEIIIIPYPQGKERANNRTPDHTSMVLEELTELQVHNLKSKLQAVLWQFERDCKGPVPTSPQRQQG